MMDDSMMGRLKRMILVFLVGGLLGFAVAVLGTGVACMVLR